MLLRLDRDGKQEGRDGDADDDVRQRQRLDDGVDRLRSQRDVLEDRGAAVFDIADREQQHVGRRLGQREGDDEVDEVAAPYDPEDSDEEDPGSEDEWQVAHDGRRVGSISTARSLKNSLKSSTKAAVTSSPDAQLRSGMLPPEESLPATP